MRIISGRPIADTIRGTSVAEEILAGAGNDTVFGGGGDDIISGGAGNDALNGEAGNDTLKDIAGVDSFNGGDGYDTLDYAGSAGRGVDVFLHLGYGGRDATGDTYAAIENVTGTAFQDFLWGTTAVNVLNGGAGNDYLRGFDGNDQLIGDTGNDQLYGDAGNDTFRPGSGNDFIEGGAGTDSVNMSLETSGLTINFLADRFSGPLRAWGKADGDKINAENLTATNFDDEIDLTAQTWHFQSLNGAAGDDILAGATTFTGGRGEDMIFLKSGKTEFVNLQHDLGIDTIFDFDGALGDSLVISKSAFGLTSNSAGAPDYRWVDTTDAPVALAGKPTFIYEKTTQILWFDGDGTGSAKSPIAIADFDSAKTGANTVFMHPTAADLIFVS